MDASFPRSIGSGLPPAQAPQLAGEAERGLGEDRGAGSPGRSRPVERDSVSFSRAGLDALAREAQGLETGDELAAPDLRVDAAGTDAAGTDASGNALEASETSAPQGETELGPEEREQLRKLAARDAEVRAHESAHLATAGSLARGGASYEYQRGPDGRDYAVGGEVQISLGSGSTSAETVELADRARRAALAPAEPSGADRAIAAEATQRAASARAEMRKEQARGPEQSEAADSSQSRDTGSVTDALVAADSDAASARSSEAPAGIDSSGSDEAESRGRDSTENERRTRAYAEVANRDPGAGILAAVFG